MSKYDKDHYKNNQNEWWWNHISVEEKIEQGMVWQTDYLQETLEKLEEKAENQRDIDKINEELDILYGKIHHYQTFQTAPERHHTEISLFETLLNFIFAFVGIALYVGFIWLLVKAFAYIVNSLASTEIGKLIIRFFLV